LVDHPADAPPRHAAGRVHRPHGGNLRRETLRPAFVFGVFARPAAPADDPRAERRVMRLSRRLLLAAALLPALAALAPAQDRESLFRALRQAPTERQGRMAEDAIWRMWMEEAPTPAIAEAIAEAMQRRERYDWGSALDILNS